MMRLLPTISHGVLLTRHGDVHRNVGGQTKCGELIVAELATTVTTNQAMVYGLALCSVCYRHQPVGGA